MTAREPREFDPEQVCLGKPEDSECWMEGSNLPGCHVWNWNLRIEEGVTEGFYESSRERGNWTMSFPNGTIMVGPFKGGKKHGYWVERYASGIIEHGRYLDGARHGRWIYHSRQGTANELTYEHGRIKKGQILR